MRAEAALIAGLDQAYDRQSWHGTNLRGSIRGLSATQAAARPAPGRHNIWEIVVHCAYWKYAVWRRLTGAPRGSFPLAGSNWWERPVELTPSAWRVDVALLARTHLQLREVVSAASPAMLIRRSKGSRFTNRDLVLGITAHDLYHAGQIQYVKRLVTGG